MEQMSLDELSTLIAELRDQLAIARDHGRDTTRLRAQLDDAVYVFQVKMHA
jgi:hypothetical protein